MCLLVLSETLSSCCTHACVQVTEVVCSFDGRYVFTSGGEDCVVNMWRVNTESVLFMIRSSTHAHIHSHAHTFICTHTHMHTHSHAHTFTCTHTHIHTHSHAHTLTCTHSHMHILSHAHTHMHTITYSCMHIPI